MSQGFVHLHTHSTHSRLDGMIHLDELMPYLKENGMDAVAITDHGVLSGAIELYTQAKKYGIKPIVGLETYLVEDHLDQKAERFHEGLLAMDWQGYQNLVRLSTLGFTDGLQRNYFACIDDEQIRLHAAGLICLSGCISSRLARTVLRGLEEQKNLIARTERVVLYKQDPLAFETARAEARKLALSAAKMQGPKKAKTLLLASDARADLDEIARVIEQEGTAAFVDDLHQAARAGFDKAWARAQEIIENRKSIFGDRYYLETQIVPLESQILYNGYVRQLSELTKIPCVVTNDSHYLKKDDAELHRTMLKIRTEKRKEKKTDKKQAAKEAYQFPEDQATAILAGSGDQAELASLYDEICTDELQCSGKKINLLTKAHSDRRAKWVQAAQIFYLGDGKQGEEEEVDDETVSLDAIDPGRAYSDWLAEFWVRTPQEMLDAGAIPQEMQNTVDLAARVNLEIPVNDDTHKIVHMPDFKLPVEEDELGRDKNVNYDDYLADLCNSSLRVYLDDHLSYDEKLYRKRLSYELDVISQAGFSQYFLIVWDYINYVKISGGLVGPGRGSAAASLVTFLLGITRRIDPLQYSDLMFERFLTPGRADLPDIDTDFDFDSAARVYTYCQQLYGSEKVSKIGTFSHIGVRQALADIGRVLDIPYPDVERAGTIFSDFRPEDDQIADDNRAMFTLSDVSKLNSDLVTLRDKSDKHKLWFEYADALQGNRRNASSHASGVAIANADLQTLGVPLMVSARKGQEPVTTTQFDMNDLATLGIPKFDQLKLSNLNIIAETEKLIGDDFDIETVPIDDQETFDALSRGDNIGIFQMAQNKVRGVMRSVKPRNLSDIAAIITIIRPGLLATDEESGLTMEKLFIARRQGGLAVKYDFPWLEEILSSTQGVLIYQEQAMKVLYACGMDILTTDKLRKAMSKKKRSDLVKFKPIFVESAMKAKDLNQHQAENLWASLEEFAGYAFNCAHAISYGLIGYWTSFLKTHHPAKFIAATLSIVAKKNSKASKLLLPKILEDCSQLGRNIPILPPSVNSSNMHFKIEEAEDGISLKESIRFGLGGIKNVGKLGEVILEERAKNGSYESFESFDQRLTIYSGKRPSRTALKALALSGGLDDFFSHRSEALYKIELARENSKAKRLELEQTGWKPERLAVLAQEQAQLCGNYYFVRENIDVLGCEVDNFFLATVGDYVRIGGRVLEAKLDKKSRAGKKYHAISLKTQWGDIKVDFFPPRRSPDPESYLLKLKEKLFGGSVILVEGQARDEKSMFGNNVSLPAKEYRGEYKEDPGKLKEDAERLFLE